MRRRGFDASESTVGRILKTLVEKGAVFPALRRTPPRIARRKHPWARRLPEGRKPSRPGEIVNGAVTLENGEATGETPARRSGSRGSDGGLRSGSMTGRFNFRLRSREPLRYCSRTRWRGDRERVAERDESSGAGQADMGRGRLRGCRICKRGHMGVPCGREHTDASVAGAAHPGCVGVATGLHWPENAGGSQTVPCGKRIR